VNALCIEAFYQVRHHNFEHDGRQAKQNQTDHEYQHYFRCHNRFPTDQPGTAGDQRSGYRVPQQQRAAKSALWQCINHRGHKESEPQPQLNGAAHITVQGPDRHEDQAEGAAQQDDDEESGREQQHAQIRTDAIDQQGRNQQQSRYHAVQERFSKSGHDQGLMRKVDFGQHAARTADDLLHGHHRTVESRPENGARYNKEGVRHFSCINIDETGLVQQDPDHHSGKWRQNQPDIAQQALPIHRLGITNQHAPCECSALWKFANNGKDGIRESIQAAVGDDDAHRQFG